MKLVSRANSSPEPIRHRPGRLGHKQICTVWEVLAIFLEALVKYSRLEIPHGRQGLVLTGLQNQSGGRACAPKEGSISTMNT
jgi:hypothetical protein